MTVRVLLVRAEGRNGASRVLGLGLDPRVRVVAVAVDEKDTLDAAERASPEVVALEVVPSEAGGARAEAIARAVMRMHPLPIVAFTDAPASPDDPDDPDDPDPPGGARSTRRACAPVGPGFDKRLRHAGVALVLRCATGSTRDDATLAEGLIAMAGVKVVRLRGTGGAEGAGRSAQAGRWRAPGKGNGTEGEPTLVEERAEEPPFLRRKLVLALACSTGGPQALQTLLRALPSEFPAPVLIVQHLTGGFVSSLVGWIRHGLTLRVKLAEDGERLVRGTAYFAPDGVHLGVGENGEARLFEGPPVKGFRPSGTFLFASVARVYGPSVVAAILTGMGDDGVEGLRAVHAAGGMVLAQDEGTSVVFGMPRAAIESGVVHGIVAIDAMGEVVGHAFEGV